MPVYGKGYLRGLKARDGPRVGFCGAAMAEPDVALGREEVPRASPLL